ncbi:MAG: polyphosphate kinase 2 family protein [Acidimicrobiales bacterium]
MEPSNPSLASVDLTLKISREKADAEMLAAQRRLLHLRLVSAGLLGDGQLGPPVCVVFEGWDAAGKGGAIRRLAAAFDPRHVRISQFAAPTPDEARHHFLWRFFPHLPGWGGMSILDRSWYGRVLVERVERLATDQQWKRAYKEIAQFEHSLAEEGTTLIKLWLHISHEEQLRRFKARKSDPLKNWKLTEDDWRNREKRPQYEEAVEDMIQLTDRPLAHWSLISAEQKRYGRLAALHEVIFAMEEGMRKWGIKVPKSTGAEYDDLR